jgi:hypothetical protein
MSGSRSAVQERHHEAYAVELAAGGGWLILSTHRTRFYPEDWGQRLVLGEGETEAEAWDAAAAGLD